MMYGLSGLSGMREDRKQRVLATQPAHLLAYWMQAEASGSALDSSGNGRTGTYSNVTLGQPGIGDGRTSALYASGYCNIYSAGFAGAFSVLEGTISAWVWMGAGSIADGATRRAVYLAADTSNRFFLGKSSGGLLTVGRTAGGATPTQQVLGPAELQWVHVGFTWSVAADQVKTYYNGALAGTATGLGTFVGALGSGTTLLGATSTVPANPWTGKIAHVAVWDAPLTAGEVAMLAL